MSNLERALRYPWRGEGWFWRMFPLALLQLVPVFGQIVLVGYGLSVVSAIQQQKTQLPKLQLRQSFLDGLRLLAVGLIYGFPIILMVLLTISSTETTEAEATGGIPPVLLTVIMLVYIRVSGEIARRRPSLKSIFNVANRLVTAVFVIFIAVRLNGLFASLRGGFQFSDIQLAGGDYTILFFASLLSGVITVALLVSGARFTLAGSSMLKPTATLQLMLVNHGLSVRFMLTVWLLIVGTFLAAAIGSIFLLVPGLLLLVAGNAAIWFLTAQYAIQVETRLVNPS